MIALIGVARGLPRPRLGGQRRDLAVRRIDHPGGPLAAVERADVLAAIEPVVGDAARRIGRGSPVAPIAIVAADGLRLELRRLGFGKELAELRRPLERRQRRVAPDAFEVAGRRCKRLRDEQQEDQEQTRHRAQG